MALIRAGAALAVALALAGCVAVRLHRAALPMECRDVRGVSVACPQVWP